MMLHFKNLTTKLVTVALFLKSMVLKLAKRHSKMLLKTVVKKLSLALLHLRFKIQAIKVLVNNSHSTFR